MNRIIISLIAICVVACTNNRIVQPSDYKAFLSETNSTEKNLEKQNKEISFWKKRLAADTGNFVDMLKMASGYINRFKLTGEVNDLHAADSFYSSCLSKIKNTQPEIYFSVAQNAITQHRFRDAWKYLLLADSIGVNPYVIKLLKFDAAIEIGLYQQAAENLELVKNENEFDYLIRKAKLEDHYGNPDKAIELMEKALNKAEFSGKRSMILWAKSNLADMYGHAGRIKESYNKYLEVLKLDSSYLYALKGIAWIAYSYDHNTKEAKHILHYILSQTKMPDLWLMLAEIAEWEGDDMEKEKNISLFLATVEKPGYGNMYNKYLISLYAGELKNYDKAAAIAEKEVNNRPTPETYNWLAWTYFKKGDISKAAELTETHVLNKTFEPEALLHSAYILKAKGDLKESRKLFNECKTASFELGPVTTKKIEMNL